MRIITNSSKSKNHLSALLAIIEGSDEIVICSGWMKICGLAQILPAVDRAVVRGAPVLIITNAQHTEAECVAELSARPGIVHRNVAKPYLHSKLYYGRKSDAFSVMVGSANVTGGGLTRNEELSHVISGKISEPSHAHYVAYIQKLSRLVAA
ncbi:phospholipase D-like domain-containing protein [Pseudomonas sp. ER28]|uniref:phospholipase D-like domain-containing protein n=1 Tax=Pseudomonas sp. ER28 TaxID=3033801 RepID=UPI003F5AE9D8